MNKPSDLQIIAQLKSINKAERQTSMLYFYNNLYDKINNYIQKNSGSKEEADDVFQESLIALDKLAKQDKLPEQINLDAYFFTICKNTWFKELKKKKRTTNLEIHHKNISEEHTEETKLLQRERNELLDQLILKLGDKCYQVLRYFYYEKRKMKEIAMSLSLTNEQAAKDKKASCMKNLRTLIKDKPHLLNLLR